MLKRKGLISAAASALLVSAGLAHANTSPASFTLEKPVYLAAGEDVGALQSALDGALGGVLAENKITIGGWVSAGFTYNFGRPDDQTNVGRIFDSEDQDPTLHQLAVVIEKGVDYSPDQFDIGGKILFMWGGDARFTRALGVWDAGQNNDEVFDPTEFYLTVNLPVGTGLKLTAGKFATTLGYEVIDAPGNFFYSRGFLFNFAVPLTHFGVKAEYMLGDDLEVYAAIVRGWDVAFKDNNNNGFSYMVGATYALDPDSALAINLITGPEADDTNNYWRTVLDLVYTTKLADDLNLAVQVDFGWDSTPIGGDDNGFWAGIMGELVYTLNEYVKLGGRLEYFGDYQGYRVGVGDVNLFGLTLGANIFPFPENQWGKGLVIRPEFRVDFADESIFNDASDDLQFTFGVDAVYSF